MEAQDIPNNMTVIYTHPRRTFNPEATARYGRPVFPMDKLVRYSPKWGWARVFNFPYRGSHWRPRMHTVVLSIDGPCIHNNASSPNSQAAWAVYWGRGDPKNSFGRVPRKDPQTNSRAELEAVRQAIISLHDLKLSGAFESALSPFKEVIIRLTSQYVLNAFHRDVWTWEVNGWKTSKGEDVAHAILINEIHTMIRNLEQNKRMAIRFWQTERDPHAKELAQRALDEIDSSYEE